MPYDWINQWQGIDWSNADNLIQRGRNKFIAGKIKDPLFGLVLGDVARAQTEPDLYSQNTIRNQGLDLRRAILNQWQPVQNALEDRATATGMIDSGIFGRKMGEAQAGLQSRINQGVGDIVTRAQQANEQYRQQRLANALQELMNYWAMKKGRRQTRQSFYDILAQLQAQKSAGDFANTMGAFGSLTSALAGIL